MSDDPDPGGTVVDRTGERRADVRVADGPVADRCRRLDPADGPTTSSTRPAASSAPGFVDLHTHLREPGKEEAETIETGSRAAAKGGYTCVVAMPNTDPTQDSVSVVDFVRRQGEAAGLCDVRPSGSITIGRPGSSSSRRSPNSPTRASICSPTTATVCRTRCSCVGRSSTRPTSTSCWRSTARSDALTEGAVMHEGDCCSRLGLPGWPSLAEELMVHRDIELVRLTGARVHILHLSTARSVDSCGRPRPTACRSPPRRRHTTSA